MTQEEKVLSIIRKHATINKDDLYDCVGNEIKAFDVFINEFNNKEDFEILESWLKNEPRSEKL